MCQISGSGSSWADIWPFFSGQNGTSYWILQPDSARSFLAVSSPNWDIKSSEKKTDPPSWGRMIVNDTVPSCSERRICRPDEYCWEAIYCSIMEVFCRAHHTRYAMHAQLEKSLSRSQAIYQWCDTWTTDNQMISRSLALLHTGFPKIFAGIHTFFSACR